MKKNKMYAVIFLFCLLIMIMSALRETNIFFIVRSFLFDAEYRENFTLAESSVRTEITLFQVIWEILSTYDWRFDYIIVFGTNFFQLLLPFIVSVTGVYFYLKYNSIYKMSIYREKKYKLFIGRQIMNNSLKTAVSVFAAYLVFYVIVLFLTQGKLTVYMGRTLLLDILGHSFYDSHTYLYYLLDGIIRFFLVPLSYAFFSCTLATMLNSQKQILLLSNVYYYGLSIIGFGLYYLFGKWMIYINPSVLMASGTYDSVNTVLLVMINLIPMIVSCIYLNKGRFAEDL